MRKSDERLSPVTPANDRHDPATGSGIARFLHRVGRLKTLPRTGWLDRGVPAGEAETVASHSFRTALLAWLAAGFEPELDRDRVLKLALIHDLAEALAGDLTPYDPADLPHEENAEARRAFLDRRHIRAKVRTTAKRQGELAAIEDLLGDLPPALAAELRGLWDEVDAGISPEARFVKQADKLEAYFQSREYLTGDPTRPMGSFAAEVAEVIEIPALAALRDAMQTLPLETKSVT